MSQASITSFFKAVGTNNIENTENAPRDSKQKHQKEQKAETSNEAYNEEYSLSKKIKLEENVAECEMKPTVEKNDEIHSNSNKDNAKLDKTDPEEVTGNKRVAQQFFIQTKSNDILEKTTDYNPAKSDYHPLDDAMWKTKESTPYLALARTFKSIEETQGRLKMIEILSNYFRSVLLLNSDDLIPSIYLCINALGPAYLGLELRVSEPLLISVICRATGRHVKYIKSQMKIVGDLSVIAEQSRVSQRMMVRPASLTILNLFQKLNKIPTLTGKVKSDLIHDTFVACRDCEARYFIRALTGKLRIGVAEQSIFLALATAIIKNQNDKISKKMPEATLKKEIDQMAMLIKTAFCQCPNYDKLIAAILNDGVDSLVEKCCIRPGIPPLPMLAQPTKSIREVLNRLDGMQITSEWKYDGERAQIHYTPEGEVNIFSRNQEDNTTKYPDIISRIPTFMGENVQSFIIDSEIVAWDKEKKTILPFQVLSKRKRKNVDIESIAVHVCVFAFDILYLNGKSLVSKTLIERREILKSNFREVEDQWKFATTCDTTDVEELQQFLDESIKGNCEGLMVKTLDTNATYEIAKRSNNWLKLKKDYLDDVGDSLDLVVIGGYKGKGKRTGIYGGYLLACYDDSNEEYQSICKIGTGFTDDELRIHTDFFKNHTLSQPRSYFVCDSSLEPDEWFDPVQVWEVKCADLSLSPIHKASIGLVDSEKGISLRFPRFVRIRDDKKPENATTAQEVANMYSSQDIIKNQNNSIQDIESYFY